MDERILAMSDEEAKRLLSGPDEDFWAEIEEQGWLS